jgi:hypothetical protein
MNEKTVVSELQAELAEVRAHEMRPHRGSLPPVPEMQAEAARHEPPDPLRALLHTVSTVWYLWGGKP